MNNFFEYNFLEYFYSDTDNNQYKADINTIYFILYGYIVIDFKDKIKITSAGKDAKNFVKFLINNYFNNFTIIWQLK